MTEIKGPTGPVAISDDKLANRSGVVIITLPSKGYPYVDENGTPVSDGRVRISSMTVADEKLFSVKTNDAADKAIMLIQRCCDLGKIDPRTLLIADQFFLLVKIRSVSYGNKYGFQLMCDECSKQFRHEIDLERDMELTTLDDTWREPFLVTLPVSGKTLSCRLLRVADELAVSAKVSRQNQKNIHNTGNPSYTLLLSRYIVSIDGVVPTESEALLFVERLTVADRTVLTDAIDENSPGFNPEMEVTCTACGFRHEVVIPWGSEFFRPKHSG